MDIMIINIKAVIKMKLGEYNKLVVSRERTRRDTNEGLGRGMEVD